ncbi:MAG: PAS domain-containing protein, partial [Cyanobacteria bacterium P01_F01_bin.3]
MAIEVCQVLLVDDDEDDYIVTRDLLNEAEQRIFKLTWVESYEAGLATIHQDRHDVYLLDFRLGQRNGLELLQASRQQGCNKPIILLTAVGDHDIDQQAMTSGACDYLVKGSTLNATLLERSILHAMERKRYEAQLHSLSERLQLAARSANIGIWDWDIVSDCLTWDDRMYELYGVHAFDFSGKLQAWQQRLHGDDAVQAIERLQQAIGGERDFDSVVFRIVHPDGSIRWIEAHALVQCDADGTPQRMIGVNADISDRKTAEVKLQLTNAELARATRLKDEFLANMSHELRT